jgi:hypothetical protein
MFGKFVGIVAASAIFASGAVMADTDTTIDFSGTYARPYTPSISGSFSGDLVIDTSNGSLVSASISDAAATFSLSCISGSCGFDPALSNLFFSDTHLLITQNSLIGVTTLTPASESGVYNGISMIDHGVFDTHSGSDAACGEIACIMTSIEYSAPGTGTATAPEIDPSIAASAMTILLGTLAVIRGRKRALS